VVAPEVPARRSAGCNPSPGSRSCYAYASDRLDYGIVDPPGHGTVTVAGDQAIYVPAGGFEGDDAFSYTATDSRGLTSRSARVRLAVGARPAAPAAPAGPGLSGPPAAGRATLFDVRPARRRGRWRILLRASAPATLAARLERRAKGWRRVRRLRARRIAAGPGALGLGRLRPGRYRVRLFLDGAPAATAAFTVRRVRRLREGAEPARVS
jgi:hypothetical protein